MTDKRIYDLTEETSISDSQYLVLDESGNTEAKCVTIGNLSDYITSGFSVSTVTTDLNNHINNTSNPHSVTATQVGLGNVTNNAQLTRSSNLSDVSSVTTARTNLGLGDSATLNVGTATGTVAAGDHTHSGYLSSSGGTLTGAVIDNNNSSIFSRLHQLQIINAIKDVVTDPANIQRLCFFDETTATTSVKDRSGKGSTLILSSNASTLSPSLSGAFRFLNFVPNASWQFYDESVLSFGNGTTDSPFSVIMMINPNSVANTTFFAKYNIYQTSKKEYQFRHDANYAWFECFDASTSGYISIRTPGSLVADIGSIHVYGTSYDGTSSENGLHIYKDGNPIGGTRIASNYTAMEDLGASLASYTTNGSGTRINLGDYQGGFFMIISEELTATQHLNIYRLLGAAANLDTAYA